MELSIFLKSLVRIFDIYSDANIPENVTTVIDQIRPWNLDVNNYTVEEVREGYLLKAEIPYNNTQPGGFELPNLPGFFVSFNQEPGRSYFYIRVIVPYDRDDNFIIFKDLNFNFRYANTSVLSDGINGLTISIKADIKVDSSFKFEFQKFSADCFQALRLFGSDIEIKAEGFQFNFDEDTDRIPFKTLPENGRKGIFSRRLTLGLGENNFFHIDKPVNFAFRELFVTKNGISFKFHQLFYGDIIGDIFDPASELLCNVITRQIKAAVTGVRGRVENNVLEYIAVDGLLKIPLISLFSRFTLGLEMETAGAVLNASLRSIAPATIDFGLLHLNIEEYRLSGRVGQDSMTLSGIARNIRIQLEPIDIALVETTFELKTGEEKDEISFGIDPLAIPLFGFLRDASLSLIQDKTGDEPEDQVCIKGRVRWGDINNRLGGSLPVLSDDDSVEVEITYKKDADTGNDYVEVKIRVGLADPSAAWNFLPPSFRPQVRNAQSEFTLRYDSVGAFANADETSALNATAGFSFECRLPDVLQLPANPIFTLTAGDDEGWIRVSMNISNAGDASLLLTDPVSLAINFPGLPQDEPPVFISLDAISFTTGQAADATIKLEMSGTFRFRPLSLPRGFVFADHIENLLGSFTSSSVAGTAKLSIEIKGELSQVKIECNFDDASLSADLFDMIADLAHGLQPQPEIQEPSNEVDLDIPVSFGLKGFSIQLGSIDENATERENFKFSVDFNFSFLEISSIVSFALSDRQCRIGFKELSIPLRFPKFPLSRADINAAPWDNVVTDAATEVQNLDDLLARLDGLSEGISSRLDIPSCLGIFNNFYDRYRALALPQSVTRRIEVQGAVVGTIGEFISYEKLRGATDAIAKILQRYTGEIKLKNALIVIANSVRGRLTGNTAQNNFLNLLNGLLGITDAINGVFYQDTDLTLLVKDAGILIPFNDPRNISIEGGAELTGTQPGDPLHALEGIQLGLGLSTERIYFFARSLGEPIPIKIGSYDAGSISFTHFTIGYGFTKNSFSTSFGGKLHISERLQDDADTSDNLGIGFRLPSDTSLSFRFDIIVPPPPAPIPVPYIEFDLDMQRPGLVTIADPTICAPNWDGFQFIIDNVFRVAFKRIAFSPFFGPLPILNYRYAYDLSIGDKNNGMTVICDNFLVLYGLGMPPNSIPIPFFIEPSSPYFDNLCVHMQLAGFEMNYHLQRPLPNFNPLAIFEMLGLLSDPMMRVDPNGPLANIVKVSLTDTYLRVPDWVTFIAPSLKEINKKEVNIVLNLGTVITAFQQIFRVFQQVQQTLEEADESLRLKIDQVVNLMEDPDLGKVIALIPPELRKLRAEANFGGFMAKAIFVITDADDKEFLINAFRTKDGRGTNLVRNSYRLLNIGDSASAADTENFKVRPALGDGQRIYDPADDINQLFKGIEFDTFTDADIDSFPGPRKEGMAGIIVGAMVRVFNQRYRFLGTIFEDGSFGMITAVKIEPVRLNISGIRVNLGLEILARLTLTGRRERNRYYASIAGESFASWEPIPGILSVTLGDRKNKTPVRVAIDGKGRFAVNGQASVSIYNGAAEIHGQIDANNDHCFVEGTFTFAPPITIEEKSLIFLQMIAVTKIGPGNKFLLAGSATLKILEQFVTNVKARISDEGASLEFHYGTGNWEFGEYIFPLTVNTYFKGDINIRQPNFSFAGKGELIIMRPDTGEELFKINGELELGYAPGREIYLMAVGQVRWYGMNWIGGGLELGSDFIRVFGDTRIMINITPTGTGAVSFAHIILQFELGGSFQIDKNGALDMKVKGKWMIGVRGAKEAEEEGEAEEAGEAGAFPLASQEINIERAIGAPRFNLIDIENLNFLPGKDFQVFMPDTTEFTIYSLRVDLPIVGKVKILMPLKVTGATKWGKIPLIDAAHWKQVSLKDLLKMAAIKVDLVYEDWQPKLKVKVGLGAEQTISL